jgi:branched-chain amino acid transport system substrate-binding protein
MSARLGPCAALLVAVVAAACGGGRHDPAPLQSAATSSRPVGVDEPACSDVHYRAGQRPRFVLVSTLPFQGVLRAEALQMSQAIQLVLARAGYRAGAYTVGYQACDDSTTQAGASVDERCAANGRAFARTPTVIGVIGPMYSSCTASLLPVVNRMTNGALGVISPANTYVGLTHGGPGAAPGDPQRFYPSGRRDYVRIAVADDAQGVANVLLARRLGLHRAYVLHDGSLYGTGLAAVFRRAAPASGIEVAGVRAWDPTARGYGRLARTVRHSRPDAVFLAGTQSNNGARLVSDLRARLGPRPVLLGSEGMGPPAALVQRAGRAAEGITLTKPDIPRSALAPDGRRLNDAIREQTGKTPCCYTMHAAQAAEVFLAAIAGSKGTRASVTARLRQTRVRGGLIGSFVFDRNGDTTLRRIFVYRIRHGQLVYVTVITPPAGLLGP